MAGDWIKYDVTLPDKPEVWRIAEITGLDVDAVIGKLLRVWAWFDLHTEDGICNAASVTQIDAIARHSGFSDGLLAVNWLKCDGRRKTISVPNFERHNGKTAKKRALTNERVKRFRNAGSVTTALPEKRREEKRKEEEKKTPRPALPAADRRDAGVRLEAAPATPSAGEPAEKPLPSRSPEQRQAGLRHLAGLIRQVHPPEPEVEAVRRALDEKPPIPIPTDTEDEHVQTAQA